MTEKWFTIKLQDDNYFGVVDNYSADKVNVVNGIRTENEAEWLCDLLNKLNCENEQLKQLYTELKYRHSLLHDMCIEVECDRDRYQNDVFSLEKENEQLKSQREDFKRALAEKDREIMKLRREKNQMKRLLND